MKNGLFILWFVTCLQLLPALSQTLAPRNAQKAAIETSYGQWRQAMATRNYPAWQKLTAPHRQMETRNKIFSEKRSFPAAIFEIPGLPPALTHLRLLKLTEKGLTAKAVYFGKVDFGVGGTPTENLLMLSFVKATSGWKFDQAEFLNLAAIPNVVNELKKGNLSYFEGKPEFTASGVVPKTPRALQKPVAIIAKTYVFCPGREVKVLVNGLSRHGYEDNKESEIIIGGVRPGVNEIQFTAKTVQGAKGTEALAIRVYLMSQLRGVKPILAYDYTVNEGEVVKPSHTARFQVTQEHVTQLLGR